MVIPKNKNKNQNTEAVQDRQGDGHNRRDTQVQKSIGVDAFFCFLIAPGLPRLSGRRCRWSLVPEETFTRRYVTVEVKI